MVEKEEAIFEMVRNSELAQVITELITFGFAICMAD